MNNETLVFERTSNLKVLSSFFCGVRKIDYLIHSRSQTQGLQCFLDDTNNQLIVVYDQNETPVALFVCHLAIEETFQGNRIIKQLDLIAVRNDKQRNGIGRQIMYNIEEITKSEGINYIRVDAYYDKHYSAIGFYEKCGFEPIAEKKNNVLQMVKRLSKDI